jgi:hypothetical protein
LTLTPSATFLSEAFVIVAVPVVLLRVSGLKGLLPLVVVQIVVGIAMGPSIFGRIAPHYFQMFANPQTLSSFSGVAFVGVLIFGMISGQHLDPGVFQSNQRGFWAMATANVAVPLVLGSLAGFWILVRHLDELLPSVTYFEFMAAIGICVSMSALPVLGAILGEMDLLGRRIGHLALGVAGINNIVLWILLGILLTLASGHAGEPDGLPPIYLVILLPVYLVVMVEIVRPILGAMVLARMTNSDVVGSRAGVDRGCNDRFRLGHRADATALHHRGLHDWRDNARKFTRTNPRAIAGDDGRAADALFLHAHGHADLHRPELACSSRYFHPPGRRRRYWHHWRDRCDSPPLRRKVVDCLRSRLAAAIQRSDGIDRPVRPTRRRRHFSPDLLRDDPDGAGQYGSGHAIGALGAGQIGRSEATQESRYDIAE